MTILGIDVSQWNGDIDWDRVRKAGIRFAMIRAGYGASLDGKFVRNISECNRVGIPCGVYWFSYAYQVGMARDEAARCLNAIKPYRVEYPIAFDFEYDSVSFAKKQGVLVSMKLASELANAFCSEIERAGYYPMLYANQDYLLNYYDEETENKYGLWFASWSRTANPIRPCAIWQYSEKGSVNGCSGYVDMNKCFYDFPTILRQKGLNKLADVKHWYDDALKWAKDAGISDGSRPDDTCTRAEVIVMLKRLYDYMEGVDE